MAEKPLTIKDWNLGIAESPYIGFGQMVNVDIFTQPGSLKISNMLEADAPAGLVTELVKWTVQDPNTGDVFQVDRSGRLYKREHSSGNWSLITGHGVTNADGQGLGIWKGYIFYARQTKLDVCPLSDLTDWTNDWKTLESSAGYDLHPIMKGQDDFLYIGNAQYVDTINEATPPFDPANAGSYTYNAQDLELGSDYRIVCLEQQGSDIAMGTIVGTDDTINTADIFLWDGTSDSFALNKTVRLAENGVKTIKNIGNVLYTMAGTGNPRLFQSMSSVAQELKRFNNISREISDKVVIFPDSSEQKDGELLLGVGQFLTSGGPSPMGVYSVRNGVYVLRNLISSGRDGSDGAVLIGSVKSISSEEILVSWFDSQNADQYGVDILRNRFYSGYTAYVETPLYTVGTESDPKTYERVEVRMGRKLRIGDGVRIKARKSLDEDFTLIAEFNGLTYAGRYNFESTFKNLDKFGDVQFRIELNIDGAETTSPELKQVIFH